MSSPARPARGLLDTSVVIDLGRLAAASLPVLASVSAISLAELAAGTHTARTATERAARLDHLQRVTATLDPIPFDDAAARAYGRVFAAVAALGRSPRRRVADLMIASTAIAAGLPLYTRNPDDVRGLGNLVQIIAV